MSKRETSHSLPLGKIQPSNINVLVLLQVRKDNILLPIAVRGFKMLVLSNSKVKADIVCGFVFDLIQKVIIYFLQFQIT